MSSSGGDDVISMSSSTAAASLRAEQYALIRTLQRVQNNSAIVNNSPTLINSRNTTNVNINKVYNDNSSQHHYEEPSVTQTSTAGSRTTEQFSQQHPQHQNPVRTQTPTTCLVRTQSGTRFMFPTEMDSYIGGDALLNSSVIRGPGIITSRTVGSKTRNNLLASSTGGTTSSSGIGTTGGLIGGGPSLNSASHQMGFNNFSSTLQSRFGKNGLFSSNSTDFFSRWNSHWWKIISLVLFVICVTLTFCLLYSLSINRHVNEQCSCPVMIEDSSSSSSSSTSTKDLYSPSSLSVSCPVLCSGRGQYVRGVCVCNEGWKGQECDIPSNECEITNCSGHGSCVAGNCQCYPGYKGRNCEIEHCPLLCSGHGAYIGGLCTCHPEWKGKECHLRKDQCDPKDCHGHGICIEGDCVCKPGWKGKSCELSSIECEVADCNGHGTCLGGICRCHAGFKGIGCEIEDCLDPTCSDHGVCHDTKCHCKPGWRGDNCSIVDDRITRFFPNCSFRGVYDIESEKCACFHGYSGDNCSQTKCNLDCGPHGSCEGSSCVCTRGWRGSRCDQRVCDPRCNEHGKCSNGTCICNPGYYGKHCTLNGCPNGCSGHDRGECVKTDDYVASAMSSSSDSSSPSGHSASISINSLLSETGWFCRCKPGWTGLDCSHAIESNCADDIDNDNDGLIDCADSECCSRPECRDSLMCLTSPEPLDILLRKPPPPVTASFYQKMKFLIDEGSVQSYAHRDEYSESRVSVVRGRVVTPDFNGLTGIRISVATDPQFGFTLTRPDGWFDILVNGGSMVTLQFQRSPFHPIKRTVLVPWNEIVVIQTSTVMTAGSESEQYYSVIGSSSPTSDSFATSISMATTMMSLSEPYAFNLNNNQIGLNRLTNPLLRSYNISWPNNNGIGFVCPDHNYERMKPKIVEHPSSSDVELPGASFSSTTSGSSSGVATQESAGIGESQTLQETLSIPGSSVKLMYKSSSAPGFLSTIHLMLTGSKIPSTLKVIHLRVIVEGNYFSKLLEPDPFLRYTYSWNKRNVYRQKVYGLTTAKVFVGYEYSNCLQVVWSTLTTSIRGFDMEISELGSWNLNVHHRYNFHQGVLQKGDGSAVFFKQQARLSTTLIGSDSMPRPLNCPIAECEGNAKTNRLLQPISLTSGSDGSVFVGDANLIRRITPEGYVFTVFKFSERMYGLGGGLGGIVGGGAGGGGRGSVTISSLNSMSKPSNSAVIPSSGSASGSPPIASSLKSSTSPSLNYNYHIRMSPYDNLLYVSDPERHQILRVHTIDRIEDPESNFDVFVGSGLRCLPRDPGLCGDGGSAIESKLSFPKGLAFTFDGSLYFADGTTIRVVNRRGIIHTIIGGGGHSSSLGASMSISSKNPSSSSSTIRANHNQQWQPIPCGEAIPASQVTLRWPTELSIHPIDGSLYFIDDSMLLRLLPDHRVIVVAGLASYCKTSSTMDGGISGLIVTTSSSSSSEKGGPSSSSSSSSSRTVGGSFGSGRIHFHEEFDSRIDVE